MADGAPAKVTFCTLLLLGLMLAAQSLALVHGFDHAAAGGSSQCVECAVGSCVEAAVTDAGDRWTSIPAPAAAPVLTGSVRKDSPAVAPIARGPPTFL